MDHEPFLLMSRNRPATIILRIFDAIRTGDGDRAAREVTAHLETALDPALG